MTLVPTAILTRPVRFAKLVVVRQLALLPPKSSPSKQYYRTAVTFSLRVHLKVRDILITRWWSRLELKQTAVLIVMVFTPYVLPIALNTIRLQSPGQASNLPRPSPMTKGTPRVHPCVMVFNILNADVMVPYFFLTVSPTTPLGLKQSGPGVKDVFVERLTFRLIGRTDIQFAPVRCLRLHKVRKSLNAWTPSLEPTYIPLTTLGFGTRTSRPLTAPYARPRQHLVLFFNKLITPTPPTPTDHLGPRSLPI